MLVLLTSKSWRSSLLDLNVPYTTIKILIFAFGLALFLGLGLVSPFRTGSGNWSLQRWGINFGLSLLSAVVVFSLNWTFGWIEGVGSARTDLFEMVSWYEVFLWMLFLDFAIYVQHLAFHKVPLLWRVHRVHHLDQEFDSTTGVRFHPLEAALSFGFKVFVVWLFSVPIVLFLIYEVLLNFFSLFNHANFSLPERLERRVRAIIITPDLHRIHHSPIIGESQSNLGASVVVWDQLFGTYRLASALNLKTGSIGEEQRRKSANSLWALLVTPFF